MKIKKGGKGEMNDTEKLKLLEKIVESDSPATNFALSQMSTVLREGDYIGDKLESITEPIEGIPLEGTFLIQTKEGKFLYASIHEGNNRVIMPLGTIAISEFFKIVKEALSGYRQLEPEDLNYCVVGERDVKPTKELIEEKGRTTLISERPVFSDSIYLGHERPNWGRVEIDMGEFPANWDIEEVTLSGGYTNYSSGLDSKFLVVDTNSYDLSWNGSPDIEGELYSNRGKYGSRAYALVTSKKEMKRLIPEFREMVKKIIGDDKIISISISPGWSPTLEQVKEKFKDVQLVTSGKRLVFKKGDKPKIWDWEDNDEGFPTYYFPIGNNEVGLLIDRSASAYVVPYLFYRTKWFGD